MLRAERDPAGGWPSEEWARWWVVDDDGGLVGVIYETRPFDGERLVGVRYSVAHNPTGEAGGALWHGEGYATVPDALAALSDHLAESP